MRRREFSRRKLLKGSAALALGGVFAAPIRAAAPPPQAITPELIDAAKKEGKIVFVQSKPGRRKLADIKLMKEDPAGVEAMAEEIKARYARLFRV